MDAVFGRRTAQVGGFRLLHRLGGGGFGEVYYGEHVTSHAPAAVKLMHGELLASHKESEYRSRFAREADFLRHLQHPAVPRLFVAEPHASRPWLATEYVAGPTLQQLVDAHGPLPAGAVRALAIRVAEVLNLLHSKGRAHRDLNPRNVLVTPAGPHVIDFGLARAVGAQPMTATGEAVGTLLYMPPERPGTEKGTHYDAAGDLFGLGAIALFAATGHPPYKNYGDLRAGDVDFHGVPNDLDIVLRRLLDAEPEERPSAAGAMILLRTSRTPGAPVPGFAEALPPAHRGMLDAHPLRPVPAAGPPANPHRVPTTLTGPAGTSTTSHIIARGPAREPLAPRRSEPTPPEEIRTEFISAIRPGAFAGEFRSPPPRKAAPRVPAPPHEPADALTRHYTPTDPDAPTRRHVPDAAEAPTQLHPAASPRDPGPRAVRPPAPVRPRAPMRTVRPEWERPLDDWVQYVAATRDGIVLAATADGMVTAMNGHTGYFQWDYALPGGLRGTPVSDGALVHAGSADGWLNTLDTAAQHLTDRRPVGSRVIGCAVAPGRVVVATASGVVWCFPATHGQAEWGEPVGAPITAGPVVAGRTVYVGDARGRLHALDLHDGGSGWPRSPELGERPIAVSVTGGLVVAAGADGGLYAFDAVDGSPHWTARSAAQTWACVADPASDTVSTGALDGAVRTYHAATGEQIGELPVADGIRRSLAHVGGALVVGGTDGSTLAVDPLGGHRIWRHAGAGPVHAPAAAVPGGPVVVGRLDGTVCALPPP
ncbi:protein kinase domain-containing protein [Yinghuangia sp. YIM S09857]|uniref:serine/threonine-protein kinase n=1 Tax=Yinghuangia sp. YIM S09857 TaxID=3436929 RepID=UPI003F5370B2